jgi:uncharacterized protein YutE (UPF0331/DUF86 family)
MIQKSVICAKLAQLRERQGTLEQLSQEPREEFLRDPIKVGAAERGLQVGIEICLDLGHHLIAGLGLPRPTEYREVFRILGEAGVIAPEFAARLEPMAAFRNRLVHVYADVDPEQVYEFLRVNRSDLEDFARAIARFVSRQDAGNG